MGYVRRAKAQEPRAERTESLQTAAVGDQLRLSAHVIPVGRNTTTDLNLVFPIG